MKFKNPNAVLEPQLSIILVTRNRAQLFDRSLKSILAEVENDYPLAEVVVVDGGSTDGTVDILKREQHRLAYWVSEPDSGVADAANKGARLARAEVIRFIGDDDEFMSGRLSVMMEAVQRLPDYSLVELNLKEAFLDTFLLSCRVLGRGIETAFIAAVATRLVESGIQTLSAEFIPTSKNAVSANFLSDLGFDRSGNGWKSGTDRLCKLVPQWITLQN